MCIRDRPKGARSGGSPVLRALRLPIALAVFTFAAVGSQVAAQLLDLPHRLTPGASTVTTLWAFLNVSLILYVAFWATGVQHRRRSHRFPVSVEAAYAADEEALASLAGHIDDLSRHGARLVVSDERTPGERVRMVLLLDDGTIEVTGEVATVKRVRGTQTWRVGVGFDPMEPAVADTIVSWCFQNPFGSTEAVVAVAPERAPARAEAAYSPTMLAAAETASTSAGLDPAGPDPGAAPA